MSRNTLNPLSEIWQLAGGRLGLKFTDQTTLRAACPFCRKGQLAFYPDPLTLGRRFITDCCHQAGDQFDLVARLQRISYESATRFLLALSGPLADLYAAAAPCREPYLAEWKRLESVWNNAVGIVDATRFASFGRFVKAVPLCFSNLLTVHRSNLNEQYRWLSPKSFSLTRQRPVRTTDETYWPDGADGVLISRLYEFAGRPSGLLYRWLDRQGNYRQMIHAAGRLVDGPLARDAGVEIHPDVAPQSGQLVVCLDGKFALQAACYEAHHGSEQLNQFAVMFDEVQFQRHTVLPLRNRPIILWVGTLTPLVLRAAIRLNASICTHGHRKGVLTEIGFESIEPRLLRETPLKKSSYWESCLARFASERGPQELRRLVKEAQLTQNEIERVKDALPGDMSLHLKGDTEPDCRSVSVVYNKGTVEQTSEGWRYVTARESTIICSVPWRIQQAAQNPAGDGGKPEPKSLVEFYEQGRWQGCAVSTSRLRRNTSTVLHEVRAELGLPELALLKRFQTDLHYLSLLINPPSAPKQPKPIGVDLADGLLRTNRCEVGLSGGELQAAAGLLGEKTLLPLADEQPPRGDTVRRLLESPTAKRLISALTVQLYLAANGQQPIAVLNRGAARLLAERILTQTGMTASSLAIPFEQLNLKTSVADSRQIRRLTDGPSIWAASGPDVAHWLAALRPVIYTARNRDSVQFDFSDAELQRTVLHLLVGMFRNQKLYRGREAIQHAWDDLLAALSLKEPPSERNSDTANRAPVILTVRHAIGYWLSKGIRTGWFACQRSQPRKCGLRTLWFADDQKTIWVSKVGLNGLLESYRLPVWDLSELFVSRSADPLRCDILQFNQTVYLRLSINHVDEVARQMLHGAPATAPIYSDEKAPADEKLG